MKEAILEKQRNMTSRLSRRSRCRKGGVHHVLEKTSALEHRVEGVKAQRQRRRKLQF